MEATSIVNTVLELEHLEVQPRTLCPRATRPICAWTLPAISCFVLIILRTYYAADFSPTDWVLCFLTDTEQLGSHHSHRDCPASSRAHRGTSNSVLSVHTKKMNIFVRYTPCWVYFFHECAFIRLTAHNRVRSGKMCSSSAPRYMLTSTCSPISRCVLSPHQTEAYNDSLVELQFHPPFPFSSP